MQRCVVIADDDPTIIDLVKLRLGLAQYHVVSANDAAAALELVHIKKPVAVLLDVNMPGGGLSVLTKIKSDPSLSAMPVMMLTGERDPAIVMQAMSGGANDYMVKPFNPDALLERVGRLVKSSAIVWAGQGQVTAARPMWEI
jgi:DNA-binding response OmpR family regulator